MLSLFFHRVLPDRRLQDYSDLFDPTYRDFDRLLARLARRGRFVSTAEVAEALAEGRPLDPRWVHISCDDGFASVTLGAELCAKRGAPLTAFVTSRVLEGYVPWFVRRTATLAACRRPLEFRGRRYDPRRIRGAFALHNEIKQAVYGRFGVDPQAALDEVFAELGVEEARGGAAEKFRFLTAAELAELARDVEVGSHGASHSALTACDEAQLGEELDASAQALAGALGAAPTSISYPDGAQDARVRAAARERYRVGFAVGASLPLAASDPFAIERLALGRNLERLGRRRGLRRLGHAAGELKARW